MTDTARDTPLPEPPARRSRILAFAAWVASAWLCANALDAGLSVLDELLAMAAGSDVLRAARNAVALLVALATLPLVLLVIFVPHLPRLVLLPPVAFLLWASLGAPPLPPAEHGSAPMLALSLAQLALAANALRLVHRATGRWRLSADRFPVLRRLWLRTVVAFLLTALLGTVAVAGLTAAAVVSYLEAETGGYMDIAWSGIAMRETVLERDGTTVRLVATSHIAEPGFYRALRAGIPDDALVLLEGVSDRNGRLQGFSQREAAQALGLASQDVFNELLPGIEEEEDLDSAGADEGEGGTASRPKVVRADVDADVFSDRTVEYLRDVDVVLESGDARAALASFARFSGKYTEAEMQAVFAEIIGRRNQHVLGSFDRLAGDYATVVIPWGAMHMPGLEKGLTERRFRIVSTRTVPMARFGTMLPRWTGE